MTTTTPRPSCGFRAGAEPRPPRVQEHVTWAFALGPGATIHAVTRTGPHPIELNVTNHSSARAGLPKCLLPVIGDRLESPAVEDPRPRRVLGRDGDYPPTVSEQPLRQEPAHPLGLVVPRVS